MGLKILSHFWFESCEGIFEKPENLSFDKTSVPEFLVNMFVHIDLLESMSNELKAGGRDQNFVLFLNMDLEILFLLLFKSSEGLFERPEKLFLMVNQQVFIYLASPFSNMLKIVGVGRFVERTLVYKT